MLSRTIAILTAAVLVCASCSGGGGDGQDATDTAAPPTTRATTAPTTAAPRPTTSTVPPTTTIPCDVIPSLDTDGSVSELVEALDIADQRGIPGAGQLRAEVEGSGISAGALAAEALGRLRWNGTITEADLDKLRGAAAARCGADDLILADDLVDVFGSAGPRREGDTVLLGDYLETCDGRPITVDVMGVDCGGSTFRYLDLRTGALAAEPPENGATVVDDRYVWWSYETVPAQGLSPEVQEAVLRSAALDGSDVRELVRLSGRAYGQLLGHTGRRVVSLEGSEPTGEGFVLRDLDTGAELARSADGNEDGAAEIIPGLVELGGVAIDLVSAEVIQLQSRAEGSDIDPCGVRVPDSPGFFGSGENRMFVRGDDGRFAAQPAGDSQGTPVGDGLFGRYVDRDAGYHLINSDGTIRWTIPDDVVADYTVVAGTLFVRNTSDQIVQVDPTTGTEAPTDRALAAVAEARLTGTDVVIDPLTGRAAVGEDGTVRLLDVPQCRLASLASLAPGAADAG